MLPPDRKDTQSTQSSPSQPPPATRAIEEADVAAAIDSGISKTRQRFSPPTQTKRGERVHSFQLHAGASLHVLPQRDVPVVAARAAFSGGLLADEEPRAGLSCFLASMWTRGTRQRSAGDFARTVENLAAEVEGFAGRNSQGVVLEITSDKLSEGLDLFTEVILEPAFDAEEFEREQRETLAAIERREDRLAQRAFLLFAQANYKHHPYRLSMIGSHESVTHFDLDAVRAHHTRVVQGENLVIGLSGDVDPEAVAEALSVRLEGLPHGNFVQPTPPPKNRRMTFARFHSTRTARRLTSCWVSAVSPFTTQTATALRSLHNFLRDRAADCFSNYETDKASLTRSVRPMSKVWLRASSRSTSPRLPKRPTRHATESSNN